MTRTLSTGETIKNWHDLYHNMIGYFTKSSEREKKRRAFWTLLRGEKFCVRMAKVYDENTS